MLGLVNRLLNLNANFVPILQHFQTIDKAISRVDQELNLLSKIHKLK